MNYTIRQGDTIYRLAVLFYFNWQLWPLVYYPNVGGIGDDPFVLAPNVKIKVVTPLLQDILHVASEGDTSYSLAERYYGTGHYYRSIDEANDWPPFLISGITYRVPALLSQMEYDAAKELRKQIHVEFE